VEKGKNQMLSHAVHEGKYSMSLGRVTCVCPSVGMARIPTCLLCCSFSSLSKGESCGEYLINFERDEGELREGRGLMKEKMMTVMTSEHEMK